MREHVRTPQGTLTIVGIVVGVALAAAAAVQQSAAATPEERVAECRAEHGAPGRTGSETSGEGRDESTATWTYSNCTWPPVPGVSEDGYYEIEVTTVRIPGTAGVDQHTEIQTFRGPCRSFRVQYRHANDIVAGWEEPLQLQPGQVVSMHDGRVVNPIEYEDLLPEDWDSQLSILGHFRFDLARAECAEI